MHNLNPLWIEAAKEMFCKPCNLDNLGISESDINLMKGVGYAIQPFNGNNEHYIPQSTEAGPFVVSDITDQTKRDKFLEIGDFHTGSSTFREKALRNVLECAEELNCTWVHIGGDLVNSTDNLDDQILFIYKILSDYGLKYFSIKGNHDLLAEALGMPNSLFSLALLMNNFYFVNAFSANISIRGVRKRIVHLNGKDKPREYLSKTKELNNGSSPSIIQIGHVHNSSVGIFHGIYVTQPGAFVGYDNNSQIGGYIIDITTRGGKVLQYKASRIHGSNGRHKNIKVERVFSK